MSESLPVRFRVAIFFIFWASYFGTPVLSGQSIGTEKAVYGELRPFFPRAQLRFFDKSYEDLSSFVFLNDFVPWYAQYLAERGLHGVDAGFSEKHYAELCKSQLQIWLIQRTHRRAETMAAVLVTDPQAKAVNPQLPTGWLLIKLDSTWQVFDAARFTLTPIAAFTDAPSVMAVQF